MAELRIDCTKDRIVVFHNTEYYDLGTIKNAFGNMISVIHNELNNIGLDIIDLDNPALLIEYINNNLNGNYNISLWGLNTSAFSINCIMHSIIDKREKIKLMPKELNRIRLEHSIRVNDEPLFANDYEYSKGMRFLCIGCVQEIFYGVMYYYCVKGLIIKKCEHCGRWFATDNDKVVYCSRRSTVNGYTHLSCYDAAHNIRQQCSRIKNSIETKARSSLMNGQLSGGKPQFNVTFNMKCDEFLNNVPYSSADNLSEYLLFLKETNKKREWLK